MAVLSIALLETINSRRIWRAIVAEFIGTALVVFMTCGTLILTKKVGQPPDSANIFLTAFTSGFSIATLDFILEPCSGANFNPAFTFGLFCSGRTTAVRCLMYSLAQILGGLFGAGALFFVCPFDKRGLLGATVLWNGVEPRFGLVIEIVATFVAFFFVLCSDAHREPGATVSHHAAIRVGITFTALTLAFLPYTTVSMNPARSFGPAALTGVWHSHWIYWIGPYIGATIAAVFFAICWASNPKHSLYRHGSGVIRQPQQRVIDVNAFQQVENAAEKLEEGDENDFL